jgi:hypothetical protein
LAPWLAAAALASLPLVFLALLLSWSAFPATRVEGVQGRYFIAPALLAAMALAPAAQRRPRSTWRRVAGTGAVLACAAGIVTSALAFFTALAQRYH